MEDINNNVNLRANNYHPQSEKENNYPNKSRSRKKLFLNEEIPQNSILFNVNYKPDIIINHQTSNNIRTNIKLEPSPYNKNKYNQQNFITQNKYYTIDDNNIVFYKGNKAPILNNGFIQEKIEILTNAFLLGENNLNKDKKMKYINNKGYSQNNISNIRIDNNTKINKLLKIDSNNNITKNINNNSQKDLKNKIFFEEGDINLYMNNNGEISPKYDYDSNIINPLKNYFGNKTNNSKKYTNNLEYLELMKIIFKNKHQIKINNNINGYNKYKYNNKTLNVNFNYYQIRAFKKMFKFINQFYKKCLKQYFNFFLFKINSNKTINKYDNEISNNKVITEYGNYINNDSVQIFDKIPKKTKLYKKINNRKMNKNNYKSVFNNLTSKRNYSKDLSPFLKFGNETILLNDISFKTEDSKTESELYRDSYELKKKYQQILMRKRRSKLKNKNMNRTFDNKKIEHSDIDSDSNKIRNYMKLSDKKDNSMQENSVTATKNNLNNTINKYKKNIRIKKLDYNNKFGKNKRYDKEVNILKNKNKVYKIRKNKSFNQNHDKLAKKHKIAKNYAFTVLIKNICTKDGRINIYINYYFLLRNNSPLVTKYNKLKLSNYFSITYIINRNNNNSKLSSIIEEESQNPYFYYDTNKKYNDKNNNKINNNYQK